MEKVYLNVNESDIFYRFQNFKFYFSSKAVQKRFIKKLELYINEEKNKLINKYGISIEELSFNLMFAFILYNKTEKRGFKVEKYCNNVKTYEILEMPKFAIWGEYSND